MKEAVIVAACRTAVGRAPRGTLRLTRPEYMGTEVVKEVIKRTPGLNPLDIDDVVMGCSFPEAEQGMNLARVLVQKSGLPDEVSGITINRFCSSGLNAISMAAERIMVGAADCLIAGGVESMSMVPMGGNIMAVDPEMGTNRPWDLEGMGMTAENVAADFNITREEQDIFAVQSNERAIAAIKGGKFKDEIVPLTVTKQRQLPNGKFELYEEIFDTDECPRGGTVEGLSKLRPAFKMGGCITAGNSSQTSDGAAARDADEQGKGQRAGPEAHGHLPRLCRGRRAGQIHGHRPCGRHSQGYEATGHGRAADGPHRTQTRPLPPRPAIASVSWDSKTRLDVTNVNGGAIALGHPLGCTGAKLTTQLVHEMAAAVRIAASAWSPCASVWALGAAGVFEKEEY